MDAALAFSTFVTRALVPARAARFAGLAASHAGQRKLLRTLDHDLVRALRPDGRRTPVDRAAACYAYHVSVGFGTAFPSVADAWARLADRDGWLIVLRDGSAGIYRPEGRWTATAEIGR